MKRILTIVLLYGGLSATVLALQQAKSTTGGGGKTASIWGGVKDAAGKPVDGALVSIKPANSTMTTHVFTDENGEYVTPPMPAQHYAMWAQAAGFATERTDVGLDGPATKAFTL